MKINDTRRVSLKAFNSQRKQVSDSRAVQNVGKGATGDFTHHVPESHEVVATEALRDPARRGIVIDGLKNSGQAFRAGIAATALLSNQEAQQIGELIEKKFPGALNR
jgi:hypothetical protein